MADPSPDLLIRNFRPRDHIWASRLSVFPLLPPDGDWHVDHFLNRIGPFLSDMPDANDLSAEERADLRRMLALYAGRLRGIQQQKNWLGRLDTGASLASAFLALIEPISFGLTVFAGVRGWRANSAWKQRRAILISIAEWLEALL